MLKLYFVAKDTTKAEARKVASQDYTAKIVDLRVIGAVITTLLILVLSVSNISLRRDKKLILLADDATISGLEQNVAEKQDKINSLEKQLKAQKEKVVEATEDDDDHGLLLEEGIIDNTLYEYGVEGISFMKFSKPVNELDYKEDRASVNHNVALSNTENSSSAIEWGEAPEEIEGCYLLVEMDHEWGYIPLDLNVKYSVSYREFMMWKNCYVVFQKMPEYAAISIANKGVDYGFKEGSHSGRDIKDVGDGGYAAFDISDCQHFASPSESFEIELFDYVA